jgi:hypothetical protein
LAYDYARAVLQEAPAPSPSADAARLAGAPPAKNMQLMTEGEVL